MPYTVCLISSAGIVEITSQPKAPGLAQLQKAVDGYIEMVPHFTKLSRDGLDLRRGRAYADENGISKGRPFNPLATTLWLACLGPGPFSYQPRLYGDVVFYAKTPA